MLGTLHMTKPNKTPARPDDPSVDNIKDRQLRFRLDGFELGDTVLRPRDDKTAAWAAQHQAAIAVVLQRANAPFLGEKLDRWVRADLIRAVDRELACLVPADVLLLLS